MLKKIIAVLLVSLCSNAYAQEYNTNDLSKFTVEDDMFHMGVVAGFAEVVSLDVKQIGLSEMFTAEEADNWEPVVQHIAERNEVMAYRESDFLVTDLFPASKTDGLTLFVIYKGDTLEKYKALKARKKALIAAGKYDKAGRREVAEAFGALLDYSDEAIDRLIEKYGIKD